MFKIFLILLTLCIASILGSYFSPNAGYLYIRTETLSIETTLWIGISTILLFFYFIYIVIRTVKNLSYVPQNIYDKIQQHRRKHAQYKTNQGLIEFSEGYWQSAQKHLIQGLSSTEIPLFNYLTAARSAQKLNDPQQRDNYLREAQQTEPQAQIAVKLTQAQLQIASKQWEQALASLQHLHELRPKHPYVIKLLAQLYETVKDWEALCRLLPKIKKYGSYLPEQYEALYQTAYLNAFEQTTTQCKSIDQLHHIFKNLPKNIQTHTSCIQQYAQACAKLGDPKEANKILKNGLQHTLNEKILELYGDLPLEENKLQFAQKILDKNPHNASIHLLIGKLYLKSRLFGQAKNHFEQSLTIQPNQYEIYYLLGETMEALERPNDAFQYYKQGLKLTTEHNCLAVQTEDSF